MTRLVNDVRRQIKNAIMADVPKVDYQEQIRKAALKLAVFELPAAAKRLWDDPTTRGLLDTHSIYFSYAASCSIPGFEARHQAIQADPRRSSSCAASTRPRRTFATAWRASFGTTSPASGPSKPSPSVGQSW